MLSAIFASLFLLSATTLSSPVDLVKPIKTNVNAKLIVGGAPVSPKFKYSWLVSLERKSSSFHYCGGSLINPTTIVTAAHCSVRTKASDQKVVAHRHDLGSSLTSEQALVFDVVSIKVHPGYDDNNQANDVAIWKVKLVSGDASKIPQVVSLDDGSVPVADNTTVIIAGWGTTSSQGSTSPILLETQVDIFDQADCKKEYPDLDPTSICAAAPGKDTCQGDSGGPLFTLAADGSVKLIGITSYGQGCADPNYAGVYSRVSSLASWIKSSSL